MDSELARELLELGPIIAQDDSARARFDRTLARLEPTIRGVVIASSSRYASSMRRAKLDIEDVHQFVLSKLFERCPLNPGGREPIAVLRTWIRVVTRRRILDGIPRAFDESLDEAAGDAQPLGDRIASPDPGASESMERAEDRAKFEECVERLAPRARRCLQVLLDDPDVSGPALAEHLDVWRGDPPDGPTKQHINLAHRIRSDLKKTIVTCLQAKDAYREVLG